jgi:CzcA family heavy metal efflux pump
MLRAVVRYSLAYPWLVLLVAVALGGAGLIALMRANYDVFPNFAPPIVTVDTFAPGLAPEDVETLATTPIEDAVIGVPGLAKLRSQSVAGLSVVTATFRSETDLYLDRDLIAQRIATAAPLLPPGARSQLAPSQSATGTVLDVGLTSARLSLIALTELTRSTIRPALLAVPGVANVVIFGARPRQWQVRVKPKALLSAHIGLNQVIQAAAAGSAIRRAGFVDTENQRFLVQSHGQAADLAQFGRTVIDRPGQTPLTLGAVADLSVGTPPPIGAALIGQKPGLLLVISAQYGANTLKVAHGLNQALDRLAPALARDGVDLDRHALQPTTFIREALINLRNSLLIGAGLILLVIVAALRNWRVALISFATIPLALLLAIVVLTAFGLTLDTFSLGGLAIALGIIVDDSIIDIENIRRRLHENQARPQPAPRLRVILDASLEVRTPIIYATLAIVVIFLPIFAMAGIAGRMFAPLAIAVIVSVLASLLLALTLTPALAALLLGSGGIAARDPLFVRMARQLHQRALDGVRWHGRVGLVISAALALAALVSLAFLPTQFLPHFHENDVIAHFLAPPGTSLPQMLSLARRTVATLQKLPQVAQVVVHIGHANFGNGHADINKAELDVTLSTEGNRHSAKAERAILAAIDVIPGVRFWANTFLTERIHEVLSGTTAPVIVHVFGNNLKAIDVESKRAAARLRRLPGAEAVTIAAPAATPSISIRLQRRSLMHYGLQPQTVLAAIEAGSVGRDVGHIYRAGVSWPVTVLLPRSQRADTGAVGALPIIDRAGRIVPLSALALLKNRDGRSVILHDNAQRVQNVTVQIAGGGAEAFLAHARKALAVLKLSPSTYLAFGGTATASRAAQWALLLAGLAAFVVILALLTVALGRVQFAVMLAANLPFALLGGIAALWIVGLPLSLGAAVGLVTVFGITLRDGLMLLSHYKHLVAREGLTWSRATAERGAVERVVPVLLTALVAALGLLPLAIGTDLPGQEIEGPMAIVILGGLITSTLLTLLVLPCVAQWLLQPEHFAGPADID